MSTITRTPRQIITSALKAFGVLGQSDDLENEQATDGLNTLNEMLAFWGIQRGMIYALEKQSYTLVSGTGSYTIGVGGVFNTDRPVEIGEHGYLVDNNQSYTLSCFTRNGYANIANKTTQGRPTELYYDPSYPLGTIYFDFVPNAAYTLKIDVHAPISSIATLDTIIVLPPEYSAAIKWNLILWLAPDFEKNPRKDIKDLAEQTLRTIKNNNAELEIMNFDAELVPYGSYRMRTING